MGILCFALLGSVFFYIDFHTSFPFSCAVLCKTANRIHNSSRESSLHPSDSPLTLNKISPYNIIGHIKQNIIRYKPNDFYKYNPNNKNTKLQT